jgi:hypothetical protein
MMQIAFFVNHIYLLDPVFPPKTAQYYSSKNCLALLQTKTLILISFEPSPAAYGLVIVHALSGHSLHRIQ